MTSNTNPHTDADCIARPRAKIDAWRYVSVAVLLLGCVPMIAPLL